MKIFSSPLLSWSRPVHFVNRCLTSSVQLSQLADAFNYCQNGIDNKCGEDTGLFQKSELVDADGFHTLVNKAICTSQNLLREALSQGRRRKMVQILDDISNELCCVADLADCVRVLHPVSSYRSSATLACQTIGQYVEELNTNVELYNHSVQAACPDVLRRLRIDQSMNAIDKRVLDLFVADFELSGVQLKDPSRHTQFVRDATIAMQIGAEFTAASHSSVLFPNTAITHRYRYNHNAVKSMSSLFQMELHHPVSDHPDALLRELTYQAYYNPIVGQESRLYHLLDARHRMAQSAGFDNFVQRATLHSLAETPERVSQFLDHLCNSLRPITNHVMQKYIQPIIDRWYSKSSRSQTAKLYPHDLSYALLLQRRTLSSNVFRDYFSLGACMEGVSQLAECLFALKLKIETVQPGEVWHPKVIKIGVYCTDQSIANHQRHIDVHKPVGIVYCDFFDRPGKPAQDCHYTIRGGRSLVESGVNVDDDAYQTPIITVQLTLSGDENGNGTPVLLNLAQVENLFHEWGHALHSILARTKYQHVTGTRCSTDLAEIPSTLFEHFALDPRVIKEYARHWRTGKSLTSAEFKQIQHLSSGRHLGHSLEISQQATYAIMDQVLHSDSPRKTLTPFDQPANQVDSNSWPASVHLLSCLANQSGLSDWLNCEPDYLAAWPHRFTHLYNYGGRYYAYLMARAGADLIWQHCFDKDPWSFTQGRLYVDKVLSNGGEYHPSVMLFDLLNDTSSFSDSDIGPSILSPQTLAQGLIDYLQENECKANTLVQRVQSPGLFRPGIYK